MYVMQTKLTLRMDRTLILTAKAESSRRGKSVSQVVGEFFVTLANGARPQADLPPVTTTLVGVAKGRRVTAGDYRKHLREKYL